MADLTATIELPPARRSVPAARRLVGELLQAWAAERYRDDATLLLSELVTNVIRHVDTGTPLVLHLTLSSTPSAPGLRISVADTSTTPPTPRTPVPPLPGRHGLHLVAALADQWGVDHHPTGKKVWFELSPTGTG
jgi:Histidine kinase-like ATPase domain